jgi:hypothetical protein
VEGADPLAPFGEHAARVLVRALTMTEAPDLYVNSSVDPQTLDVSGFEELVGVHGGLGGWQDRAVLLAPTDLIGLAPPHIEGADQLHRVLVAMLRASGQRGGPSPASAPEPASAPASSTVSTASEEAPVTSAAGPGATAEPSAAEPTAQERPAHGLH